MMVTHYAPRAAAETTTAALAVASVWLLERLTQQYPGIWSFTACNGSGLCPATPPGIVVVVFVVMAIMSGRVAVYRYVRQVTA